MNSLDIFLWNVAWLRKQHGLSKKMMAQLLGISVRSLNLIESGVVPKRLDVSVLLMIRDRFGIQPKDLFEQRLEESCEIHKT